MISISIISRVTSKRLFKGGWSHRIEVPHILGKMFSKTLYFETSTRCMMGAATGPQSVATFLLGLNFPTSFFFFFFFFFFQNIAKTRVSRP